MAEQRVEDLNAPDFGQISRIGIPILAHTCSSKFNCFSL